MTSPEQYTAVTLVAGTDTQEADLPRVGQVVLVPPGYPLGSGPSSPSQLLGIYGWTQTGVGGRMEWVMSSILDAATVQFIRDIPPTGWGDTAQRTIYRQQVRRMIQAGLPAVDARDIARILYLAARANEAAPAPVGP
jgi:hypothetical protein